MKIIGLTGGSGAGKGEVSAIFGRLGIPSVDTDAVYRELVSSDSECLRALKAEFGDGIISPDGSLDRKSLGAIVFSPSGADKLKRLNEITHGFILAETGNKLAEFEKSGKTAAIVDAPQLFESGFDKMCDAVVSVTAGRETRIRRIVERDNISAERAEARLSAQLSDEFFEENSDFVIRNEGSLEDLKASVEDTAGKLGII